MTDTTSDQRKTPERRRRPHAAKRASAPEAAGHSREFNSGSISPEMLDDLFRQSPLPFAAGRTDGSIIAVNLACCRLLGYSDDELRRLDWSKDLTPAEWREQEAAMLRRLLETRHPVQYEKEFIRKDGSRVPVGLLVHLSSDEETSSDYFWLSIYDLSERRKAEASLRDLAARYATLFDSTFDGVWVSDIDGRIVDVNNAYCRMSGYTRDELLGVPVSALEAIESPDEVAGHINRILESGGHGRFESRHRRKDGTEFDVEITALHLGSDGGRATVFTRDVTYRKQAEEALKQSQKKYQDLIEAASDFIWEMDRDGRYTYCSPQMEKIWGISPEGMVGKTPFDVTPPEKMERAVALFREISAAHEPFAGLVTSAFDSEGRLVFLETSGVPFFDGTGEFLGYRGISRDITARVQAEEALRESEERFKLIATNTPDHILVQDNDLRYTWVLNPQVGLTTEGMIGKTDFDILAREDAERLTAIKRRVIETDSPEYVNESLVSPDGGTEYFEGSYVPTHNAGGQVNGLIGYFRNVTERKRTEEALAISLAKYQVLFESFPLGISISDEDGSIVESNLLAERLLGLPREEQESRKIGGQEWRIVRPDGTPMPPEEFASVRALKGNCLVDNVEMGLVKEDGDVTWINVTAAPIPLEGFGVAITYGDVTDRRRAEEELRLQSTALQAAANGIVITDRDGNIQWVNDAFTRLTGYSAVEAIGKNPRVLKSGEHDAAFYRDLWNTILSGRVWRGEVVNKRKDGRLYYEEMTITPVRDEGGTITRFIAIKQDITARKRAEEELRRATERVQKLLGANVIGIAEFDATKIVSANRALLEMTGYSERDVARGRIDWREITPPEYAERDNRAWLEMLAHGECLPYEKEYVTKDGRRIPILIAGVRLTEDPVTGVFLNLDITDWKLMEHELEETTHYAEHLFESSLIGLSRFREGKLIDANDAFLDIVGYTRDDLKAGLIDIQAMTPPEYTALDERAISEMMAKGESAPHEKQYIRKDGSRVSVLIGRKLIKESPLEWVAFVLDLTERKRAEADLERVRTEFLGEVSHELKTPLTAIKGCASMALSSRTPPDPAEARELFQVVDTQANRLTDLVGNLLDMTRIEANRLSITPEETDLTKIVDEARVVFEHSYYPNPLHVELPSKLPRVVADGRRIVQVLTNLYSNAAKFSSSEMPIVVSAERSGREVIVHVRDGGSGIPPDKMPLLFQKFAQINTTGTKGTGLGLFICRGIIEAQGGRIWAESAGEGQGSTFSFSLPAVAAATRPAKGARGGKRASTTGGRGKRRVVAIDDEPAILRFVEHCLQNGHYDIASTTEPSAAVALVKSHNPDIVLLDMRLPGTSGLNVLEEIRRFSDVPVAFITATANREDVERGRQFGGTTWLEKPFSQRQLLDHIDRVIAGRRRRRR